MTSEKVGVTRLALLVRLVGGSGDVADVGEDFLDDASHPVAGPWARKYMPGRASLTWSREADLTLCREARGSAVPTASENPRNR